jgi:putative transposase
MAESFVDSFKTELIADRVWRTRSQLELAIVEWVGWDNHRRLHGEIGDIPPVEFEHAHALTRIPEQRIGTWFAGRRGAGGVRRIRSVGGVRPTRGS